MANSFRLTLKTSAPVFGSFNVVDFYKDNSKTIGINVTGAALMKVWINQNPVGTKADPEYPSTWQTVSSTQVQWTPNFSAEGTNYVHAVFSDLLGNETATVANSSSVVFDKTAPEVTAVTTDSEFVTVREVDVKVTAADIKKSGVDKVSEVRSVIFSGDLVFDEEHKAEIMWSDTDREAGYKICKVLVTENAIGDVKGNKRISVMAVDMAENTSEQKSTVVLYYTGGIDPVIIPKDGDAPIGAHYGKQEFKIVLKMFNGDSSGILGYKVYGDFSDTAGGSPTPQPEEYTPWGAGSEVVLDNKFLTQSDGFKEIKGEAKFSLDASSAIRVDTYSDIPETAESGAICIVAVDETKENKKTAYKYVENEWFFYGVVSVDETYTEKALDKSRIHHSEATPIVSLTSSKGVISDKPGFNSSNLASAITTSCDVVEYKVVAYPTQEAATAGTHADISNVGLYGTDPLESGSIWEAELLESKLVTAIEGDGDKFIVVYAKNLCDKWGKSNTLTIVVDTEPPEGHILVESYYNSKDPTSPDAKGITANATDANTVKYMTVWADKSIESVTPPETAQKLNYAINPTANQIDWSGVSEGTIFFHIIYEDEAGNTSVTTSTSAIYDSVAPVNCSISLPEYTTSPSVIATLTAADATSGVGYVKLFGDINGASTAEVAEWLPYVSSVTITLTSADGLKTVKALFKDKAGNVTELPVEATTTLDTDVAPVVSFWNSEDTTALATKTGNPNIRVHIGATEDISNITDYKIWGDIVGKTSEPEDWSSFSPETDKDYKSLPIQLTTGDGAKTVNVKIKDKAGNEKGLPFVITLDTAAPVITVTDVDYTMISENDTERYTEQGQPITGSKASKMTFKFTSDIKLSEFKVCVYEADKTAATARVISKPEGTGDTDPDTINMSGINKETSDFPISCSIGSRSFKIHPEISRQTDADKVGFVIVLGKSETGIWSAYTIADSLQVNL